MKNLSQKWRHRLPCPSEQNGNKHTQRIQLTNKVRQDLKKKSKTQSNMTQRNGLAKQKENVEVLCLSYNLAPGQT